ncbi:hypothetical protein FB451DRAFT_1416801 [Mycena latifolia]|nr:hypothetical protein FB451DRAFT_1416801 [Mycena latifolia]
MASPPDLRISSLLPVFFGQLWMEAKILRPYALPYDILVEMTACLNLPEILILSLTSLEMRALLVPILYQTVTLGSSSAFLSALAMLRQHPEICGCDWVIGMVDTISRTLSALLRVEWDAAEFPEDNLCRTHVLSSKPLLHHCVPRG